MRHTGREMHALAFLAALLVLAPPLAAQPHHRGCMHTSGYDASAEVVVRGTVEQVERLDCPRHGTGVHLMLESAEGRYEVHLGPEWYVTGKMAFEVAPGDELTVVGAPGELEEGVAPLVARQVTSGDDTVELRDARGVPVWAGSGAPARGRR